MYKIELKITAKSPLAIGRRKPGGSVSETENYITGSVIRGTIANLLVDLAERHYDDLTENGEHFQQLFLDENPAIFQNAYPAETGKETIRVIPATAVSSKTKSGFINLQLDKIPIIWLLLREIDDMAGFLFMGELLKSKKGNGVFDTLIDRFCAEKCDRLYDPNCPKDGGRVEPFSGFYSRKGSKYSTHSPTTRLLTRVGINRRRATSEENILYSIHVINEVQGKEQKPTTFIGAILLENENLAESLKKFIDSRNKFLRFGSSTSRGLGKVEIETSLTQIQLDVTNKVDAFNTLLQRRWKEWQIFNPGNELEFNQGRTYFTIDLQSDAIFTDNWLRTTVITEAILKQFANVTDSSLKLEVADSSYDYFCGWNSAWGLKKDTDLITNKGGVYLFSTENYDSWKEKLALLELKGVGDKTVEGFGQIEICNEFHLVLREDRV